ncbi:uncharacterized protein LOC121741630 [Salvia splendens]|uniref:uncharacterized protein LOC121741630 n=1 Tax=Salvia splendens TaxID=180675 RepID=UPI001C275C46|nr:uncharacterized protein LOC121741630 [Salvia splendens]
MKRSFHKKEENDDVAENASNQTVPQIESPPLSPPPPPPPARRLRRRLLARMPYQQKHLNVAEARREIVAALKHHRATAIQPKMEPRSLDFSRASASKLPLLQGMYPYAIQPKPKIEPRRLDFTRASASKSPPLLQGMYPYASNRSWICPHCFSPWPAVMLTPSPPPPDAGFHDFEVPWMGLGLKLDVEAFVGKPYKVYIDGAPPVEIDEDEIDEEMADDEESGCGVEKQCEVDLQQDSALPGLEIEETDGVDGDWLN